LPKAVTGRLSGRSLLANPSHFAASGRVLLPNAGYRTIVRSVAFAKSEGPDERQVGRFCNLHVFREVAAPPFNG
jgi:hypothetical protein